MSDLLVRAADEPPAWLDSTADRRSAAAFTGYEEDSSACLLGADRLHWKVTVEQVETYKSQHPSPTQHEPSIGRGNTASR